MELKQRLPLERYDQWRQLKYGMFIHYGMSTFVSNEKPDGSQPSTVYAPTALDVDQWIRVARDAGMRYAVLTAKHVSGHCLWPSRHTDYSVATSGDTTDVVDAFVKACRKYKVQPAVYYCSWDNHHLFGSRTPSMVSWHDSFTTPKYWAFKRPNSKSWPPNTARCWNFGSTSPASCRARSATIYTLIWQSSSPTRSSSSTMASGMAAS